MHITARWQLSVASVLSSKPADRLQQATGRRTNVTTALFGSLPLDLHVCALISMNLSQLTLAMPLGPGAPCLIWSALKSYLATSPLLSVSCKANMLTAIRSCTHAPRFEVHGVRA